MGAVWVAEHLALGTEVAVKFLHGDYAQSQIARARFSQEAAAASQVKSAHVVKVYDYGITDTDVPFIVMEVLDGTDLAKRIETDKTIPHGELAAIVSQLCKALTRAHEKGVIHRDIKPNNVFLTREGDDIFVKLLDFGIAKTETVLRSTTADRRSTLAGESLGTPFYMSPEQFRSAKQIDSRSDLWSVGVLVYEALTGKLPFVAETVGGVAIAVNDASAVPPSQVNPLVPLEVDAWFKKACARDPNDRFQSANALAAALTVALGVGRAATDGEANRTGPRVVIAQDAAAGDALASLRETALSLPDVTFASTRAPLEAKRRRTSVIVALVVAAALVAGGVGVSLSRAAHVAQPAPTGAASSAATTPPEPPRLTDPTPSAIPPAASPSATAAIEPALERGPSAAPSAFTRAPTTMPPIPTTPQNAAAPHAAPSATAKGKNRDIW